MIVTSDRPEGTVLFEEINQEITTKKLIRFDKYLAETAKWIASLMQADIVTLVYQDEFRKFHVFTTGEGMTTVNTFIENFDLTAGVKVSYDHLISDDNGTEQPHNTNDALDHIFSSSNPILIKNLGEYFSKFHDNPYFSKLSLLFTPVKEKQFQCPFLVLGKKDGTPYDRSDYQQIEQITPRLVSELERYRQFSELAAGTQNLMLLNKVAHILGQTIELDELLSLIMQTAETTIGAKASSVLLLDEETNELYFTVAHGEKANKLREIRVKIGEGVAGWVAQTGKAAVVPYARHDRRFASHVDEITNFKTRNILCAPLKVKGKIIGVIEALNKKEGFNKDDLILFTSIAAQAAYAIENAKLYKNVKDQGKKLEILYQVGKMISASLDSDCLISEIIRCTARIISCRAIVLVQKELVGAQERLHVQVIHNEAISNSSITISSEEQMSSHYLKPGEGIISWIIDHNQSLLVSELDIDPRHSGELDQIVGFKVSSVLGCPCDYKGKILGAIVTCNSEEEPGFGANQLETLSMFCSQASIAMENAHLYGELEESYLASVQALSNSLDANDPYTFGHSERVTEYSLDIAEAMKLSKQEIKTLQFSGLLHDIGKIGIDKRIVNKPDKLTDDEYEKIKEHPGIGARIIQPIQFLEEKLPGIKHHHERFDGKGYPDGLKGYDISLFARIIAVADSFDAMTSHRAYRRGMPPEKAFGELKRGKGTQFDPDVVDVFTKVFEKKYASDFEARQQQIFDIQEAVE